jgi:hypothetical protein
LEHIEYLPVMDYRNQSIPADKVTSFDVNKAIQRGLTKAVARHGLGLYIYAGEDLPEDERKQQATSHDAVVDAAIAEVNQCVSRAEMQAVWTKYKSLQKDTKFISAVTARGKELAA